MGANTDNDPLILEDQVLRDGLQMEKRIFATEEKMKIFHLLVQAGVKRIQVGSFVHPKLVPQMADTDQLIRELISTQGVLLTGLILNAKGLERAINCSLTHVSMSVSASDAHSRRNVNRSAEEALASMTVLISEAKQASLNVRAGVQCAFGCVYEGMIPQEKVLATTGALIEAGADEVNLADTTGMGHPKQVRFLIRRIKELFPSKKISLHLHDTRGLGLANMLVGYEEGVKHFDACAGGLGGCPFVTGAAGNVPMEDAVHMFESMGIYTGIDLQKICKVADTLEYYLNRPFWGRMNRVLKALHCYEGG